MLVSKIDHLVMDIPCFTSSQASDKLMLKAVYDFHMYLYYSFVFDPIHFWGILHIITRKWWHKTCANIIFEYSKWINDILNSLLLRVIQFTIIRSNIVFAANSKVLLKMYRQNFVILSLLYNEGTFFNEWT